MKSSIFLGGLLVLVFVGLGGCGSGSSLSVTDVQSNACTSGDNCGVFMTIVNTGEADLLLGASSVVAARGELHTVVTDDQGGMTMTPVESIPVPTKGSVELKPGSFHIMLFALNRELKTGDTFPLTLKYQQAGDVTVQVKVQSKN